jgi:predicted nucleotidyltransferase
MHPDLLEFLESLTIHRVEFLVVGSTALAIHARPRYTEDLDLWLKRSPENTRKLAEALRAFGFSVTEEALRPFWEEERQMVTLGAKPQAIDLLNFLGDDSFEEVWSRRIEASISGVVVSVIGFEDFVRSKRAAGRPKDNADLALIEEVWGTLPD